MTRRRRRALIAGAGLAALLAAAGAAPGQNVIENPAKPLAQDAGRVLALSEVWRVTDETGAFYFRYPNQLQVADDGTVFVADQEQLLRFAPDGRFIRNVFQQGQGPGEISGFFSYAVQGRDLFIQDMNSMRFWRADFDGIYQEAINLANRDYSGLIGVLPNGFLFLRTVWPPPSERTGKLMEIPFIFIFCARDGSEKREIATFKPKDFLAPQAVTSMSAKITALSPDGKLLYTFHGRDYLIEAVDIAAAQVVRRFARAYPKVPHAEKEWESDFRKKYGSPRFDHEIDIWNLQPVSDCLWVETSTLDKAKGRLIDVFDKDGRFIDSFYLGPGKALMAVRDDTLYCQEKSEAETISIVKYRIEKGGRGR
jgi:hypothetical protein